MRIGESIVASQFSRSRKRHREESCQGFRQGCLLSRCFFFFFYLCDRARGKSPKAILRVSVVIPVKNHKLDYKLNGQWLRSFPHSQCILAVVLYHKFLSVCQGIRSITAVSEFVVRKRVPASTVRSRFRDSVAIDLRHARAFLSGNWHSRECNVNTAIASIPHIVSGYEQTSGDLLKTQRQRWNVILFSCHKTIPGSA